MFLYKHLKIQRKKVYICEKHYFYYRLINTNNNYVKY